MYTTTTKIVRPHSLLSVILSVVWLVSFGLSVPMAAYGQVIGQTRDGDLGLRRGWERSPHLMVDLSSETTPIYFSIGPVKYKVPRNYISSMDNYNGGPQEIVSLKVTYPGFEPLTEKTKPCVEPALEYLEPGPGCKPLKFWLRDGKGRAASDDDHFQNLRKLFHSQTPTQGPNGFAVYEIGPPEALIRIYRKKISDHILVFECDFLPQKHGKAICDNGDSLLPNGNSLFYRIDNDLLDDSELIDSRIRQFLDSITTQGGDR